MKRIIVLFISLLLVLSIVACSKTEQYAVLEVGGYDNISGADHKDEITLELEEHSKTFVNSKKTVKVNDIEWNVEYINSRKGYLFKNNLDYYEKNDGGIMVKVGINEDTGAVDSYSWVDVKYAADKSTNELTEEDCLNVAKAYLNKFIDSDEYVIIDVRYLEIPEYKAIYDFEFVRVIDGIKTSDKANVGVSVFGDVISHLFVSLGEMENAVLPTDDAMQTIRNNVDAKIDAIYQNISTKYDVSYTIADEILVKLSDGSYAFEYYITVDLETDDVPTKITETTKLLIYLD